MGLASAGSHPARATSPGLRRPCLRRRGSAPRSRCGRRNHQGKIRSSRTPLPESPFRSGGGAGGRCTSAESQAGTAGRARSSPRGPSMAPAVAPRTIPAAIAPPQMAGSATRRSFSPVTACCFTGAAARMPRSPSARGSTAGPRASTSARAPPVRAPSGRPPAPGRSAAAGRRLRGKTSPLRAAGIGGTPPLNPRRAPGTSRRRRRCRCRRRGAGWSSGTRSSARCRPSRRRSLRRGAGRSTRASPRR